MIEYLNIVINIVETDEMQCSASFQQDIYCLLVTFIVLWFPCTVLCVVLCSCVIVAFLIIHVHPYFLLFSSTHKDEHALKNQRINVLTFKLKCCYQYFVFKLSSLNSFFEHSIKFNPIHFNQNLYILNRLRNCA